MKFKLKPPGTQRWKLRCDVLLSTSAFKLNLRRFSEGRAGLVAVRRPDARGRAVQVDPMVPKLKPPGEKRLKRKCDILLSTSAFKFKLRRYSAAAAGGGGAAAYEALLRGRALGRGLHSSTFLSSST
jgi:hypothetical protein